MSYLPETGVAALDNLTLLERAVLSRVGYSTRFGIISVGELAQLPITSEDPNALTFSEVESTYSNLVTGRQSDPGQIISYNTNLFAYEVLMYIKRIRQDIKDQLEQQRKLINDIVSNQNQGGTNA